MIYGFTLGSGVEAILEGEADFGFALFKQLKSLGFSSVRMDAWYTTYFPISNDAAIRAAVMAGLDVLIILNGYDASTTTPIQFATFASTVVTTYSPLGIHKYEVINEPGNPANWNPTAGTTNPGLYTALLKLVYPAVHSADPEAIVALGSLFVYGAYVAPTGTWNGTTWAGGTPPGQFGGSYNAATGDYDGGVNQIAWLQTLYIAGAHGYFDVMNCHPYSSPVYATDTATWNAWYQMFDTTPSIYSLMLANGDTNTPIWITEYGWVTDNSASGGWPVIVNTQAAQAAALPIAIAQALTHNQITSMYLFSPIDTVTDGAWGLWDASGNPKPAAAVTLNAMGHKTVRLLNVAGTRMRLKRDELAEV